MLVNSTLWPSGSKVKEDLDWPTAAIFIPVDDVRIIYAV